jgi:hypothetical protein
LEGQGTVTLSLTANKMAIMPDSRFFKILIFAPNLPV